ncbi:MAG: hypothetical protein P9L94_10020 [Candidatus Hinthialibacter antarcticus]|nr:hypothetical protein [Candidatus Hinthialibacter antarcticus]
MKRFTFIIALVLCFTPISFAQDEIVPITSFENLDEDWTFSGGSILLSLVEEQPGDIAASDGNAALVVNYDNAGSAWQYAGMSFPVGEIDLTGMREIRMDVYFTPDTVGDLSVRLDLASGNILGFAYASAVGEWQTVSFPIDRKLSASDFMQTVNWIGGFFGPEDGANVGEMYIDNIRGVRPEGTVDVEEVVLYSFDEATASGEPTGWAADEGIVPELGDGEFTPKEGNNYMLMFTGEGYIWSVMTADAINDFNRWGEVQEVLFDVIAGDSYSWLQTRISIVSGIGDDVDTEVATETKELGYSDNTTDWRELLFGVDMTDHQGNINDPNGWVRVRISTNNDAADAGKFVFVDNFRVAVPVGGSDVSEWNLY